VADGGRSAEEREAARLERERRRAEQPADPIDGNGVDADHDDEFEVPIGVRRVARRERTATARASDPPPRPRPPRGSRAAGVGGRQFTRRRSILGAVVMAVAVVPVVAVIWFAVELFQPFGVSPHGRVTVTVPPHTGARQVGDILARHGVVPSGFFFDIRALLAGDRGKIRAGTYTLKLDMSYSQALKVLITPPPVAKTSNLTIVEGRTRKQIDALLHSEGIASGYVAATRHSPLLDPGHYGAPPGTPTLEGFLFPSTYQLRDPIKLSALIADQLKTFKQRFATVDLGYARSRHLTPYEVLIIASMVQAEAQVKRDFPLVASVIYNRLKDHMSLGIDATIRYATGNYTKPLTQSELNSPSPYNTRTRVGLPPTPIDNPGLQAIQAAAHPAGTNFLYFVVKPCGNGGHAFESSYSAFLADVARYYSARAQHGGKSPTRCS
jgi:uncharacterized YceG family protein